MTDDIPTSLLEGPHRDYQAYRCLHLSDEELIQGMIRGLQRGSCETEDHQYIDRAWLPTEECCDFCYPGGGHDHFNRTWLKEWIEENRPHLSNQLRSVFKLKVFL